MVVFDFKHYFIATRTRVSNGFTDVTSFWNHFTGAKFLVHFDFRKQRQTAQSKLAKRHITLG